MKTVNTVAKILLVLIGALLVGFGLGMIIKNQYLS